jgi:hypothetical protein
MAWLFCSTNSPLLAAAFFDRQQIRLSCRPARVAGVEVGATIPKEMHCTPGTRIIDIILLI